MKTMSWKELVSIRQANKGDKELQEKIAPFEHRAYARELVKDSPSTAILLPFLIPGYQVAKGMGMDSIEATPPSMEQLKEGFAGLYEGLVSKMTQ